MWTAGAVDAPSNTLRRQGPAGYDTELFPSTGGANDDGLPLTKMGQAGDRSVNRPDAGLRNLGPVVTTVRTYLRVAVQRVRDAGLHHAVSGL